MVVPDKFDPASAEPVALVEDVAVPPEDVVLDTASCAVAVNRATNSKAITPKRKTSGGVCLICLWPSPGG